MDNRTYQKASIFVTLIVVISATLLLSIVNLRLGDGFGREVNMIVNHPPQNHALFDFVEELRNTPVEVYTYPMSGNRTMIKLIGVNDIQLFLEEFRAELIDVSIESVGTFGTLASIASNIKFFQIYFGVFLLGYIIFSTYRYQRTGLITSVSVSTFLIFTMFLTNVFGFLLNNITWMALLLSFVFLLIQKQFLANAMMQIIKDKPTDYDKAVSTAINKSLYFSFVLSVLGILLIIFNRAYINAAVVFLMISIGLVIERLLLMRVLPSFVTLVSDNPSLQDSFLPRASLLKSTLVFDTLLMRILLVISIVVLLVSGSSIIFTRPKTEVTPLNHILVVQDSTPVSFLEVQASLHKFGLEDNLFMYRVSEEKTTWFKFKGLESRLILDKVRLDLAIKTNIDSSVYSYQDKLEVSDMMRYGGLIALVGVLYLVSMVYKDIKERHRMFVLALASSLVFMLISYFLGIHDEPVFNLALWTVPLLSGATLYFNSVAHINNLRLIKNTISILLILILPIIVIFPLTNSVALMIIRILIAYGIALCTTSILLGNRKGEAL